MAILDRVALEIANYASRFGQEALGNVENLRTYLIRRGLPIQNVNQAIEAMKSYVNPAIDNAKFKPPMNVYQGQGVALNAPSTAISTTNGGVPSVVNKVGNLPIQSTQNIIPTERVIQATDVVDDIIDVPYERVSPSSNVGQNAISGSTPKQIGTITQSGTKGVSNVKNILSAANLAKIAKNPLTWAGLATTLLGTPPVQQALRNIGDFAGEVYYNNTSGKIDSLKEPTTRVEQQAEKLAQEAVSTTNEIPQGETPVMISPEGVQALKNSEGFRTKAYKDSKGVWTIGYGRTAGVKAGDTTTKEKEEEWLTNELTRRSQEVLNTVQVPLTQGQLDALVNLQYNIGQDAFAGSTMVQLLNKGDYSGAAKQFARWNKIVHEDGRVEALEGLTKRRARELAMFNGKVEPVKPSTQSQQAQTTTQTPSVETPTQNSQTELAANKPVPLQWFDLLQSVYGTGGVANAQGVNSEMGLTSPQQAQQFVAQEPQLTQTEQMMIQALQPRQNNVMADIKDMYAMSQNAIMNSDPRYQGSVVQAQGYYVDPNRLQGAITGDFITNQVGARYGMNPFPSRANFELQKAQALYEANIANQAGVPYADYRAAMLERQKQLVANQQAMIEQALTYQLGMEQNDVKRAEIIQKIYDTRATAQNKLNEIQAQGMVDRDIEMRKAFGNFITKQAENDANLQQEAIKGQWDAYNKQLELNNPYYQAGKLGSFYSGTGLGLTNPQAVQNMIQAQDPNLMKQLYPQANAQTFQAGMQPQRTQASQAGLYGMMQNALQNMRQGQQN